MTRDAHSGLRVENLTVRYGGNVAIESLSFNVPSGAATGLIGPNGAGKTTTFNACSGLVAPATGRVFLRDREITRMRPALRAQHGLGRTFQRIELCEHLTVAENVALGPEARAAGRSLIGQFRGRAGERRAISDACDAALSRCGLEARRDRVVTNLSTGERRLVELARAIATGFDVLMLDEPSSGLDSRETEELAEILNQLVHDRGVGLLLVEHDISLVRAVCEYVYVVDFGRPLAEGRTAVVLETDVVKAAYLGSDTVSTA